MEHLFFSNLLSIRMGASSAEVGEGVEVSLSLAAASFPLPPPEVVTCSCPFRSFMDSPVPCSVQTLRAPTPPFQLIRPALSTAPLHQDGSRCSTTQRARPQNVLLSGSLATLLANRKVFVHRKDEGQRSCCSRRRQKTTPKGMTSFE